MYDYALTTILQKDNYIKQLMDKKKYLTPTLRDIQLRADHNFLASGFGEDAHPEEGLWGETI